MRYLEKEGTVFCRSQNGNDQNTFPDLTWLAAISQ